MDANWTNVPGYPDYAISDTGIVKRVVGGAGKVIGRILKQRRSHNGYLSVALSKDGSTKAFRVNRLVLTAFKGAPSSEDLEASHLDGNRVNNYLLNLDWETQKKNNHRRKEHMTSAGMRNGRSKLSDSDISEIRDKYSAGGTTYVKLANEYGVSFGAIGHIISNRQWKHVGVQP